MIARLISTFWQDEDVKYLFKSSKSNKFDQLQLRTKPMMTDIKSFVKKIVLAGVAFFGLNTAAQAQCVINYDGNPCVGTPIRFTGSTTGTTHDWNFNNENTQSGIRNVNYAFKTSGNKTITYVTTVNGTKCTATLNLVVYESPTIKLKLKNLYEQCFEKTCSVLTIVRLTRMVRKFKTSSIWWVMVSFLNIQSLPCHRPFALV